MKKSFAIIALFIMMISLTSFTTPIGGSGGGKSEQPTLEIGGSGGGKSEQPTFEIGGTGGGKSEQPS